MVIPNALKVLRDCLLGRLSSEVGWNHYETIKELENGIYPLTKSCESYGSDKENGVPFRTGDIVGEQCRGQ
ncbi:hypothetical protein Tco_0583093, partial [Tanacetum coccineum]